MISEVSEDKKPIRIPSEFVQYAEKHSLFELNKKLLNLLIIDRPSDPLTYLIEYLEKDLDENPSIFLFGAVGSGKHTLANLMFERFNYVVITAEDVFKLCEDNIPTPKELALRLKQRLKSSDCETRGYLLVDFPTKEAEAKALRWEGIYPEYAIFLEAKANTLIERLSGNRMDPETEKTYHLISNPPPSYKIEARLVQMPEYDADKLMQQITSYNREAVLLKQIYANVAREIDADQPLTDINALINTHITQPKRSLALRTPRIIFLGFIGSGRKTQAKLLAAKYNFITIDFGHLIKQEVAKGSFIGKAVYSYVEHHLPVPDVIVTEVLKSRLAETDCSTRGWILIGYPRTVEQAKLLASIDQAPNRVFSLDITQGCAAERLVGRRIDPVTGVRYHVAYRPRDDAITDRALQNPVDEECVVGSKLAHYAAHRDQLLSFYDEILIHVHAHLDAHTVFEEIESGLSNPLVRRTTID